MKNKVSELQESGSIVWTNNLGRAGSGAAAAVTSGQVVKLGHKFGVAAVDIAATTGVGVLDTMGRFSFKKTAGALAVGQLLGYDFTNDYVTTDLSGGVLCQVTKAAASGDTEVEGNINPMSRRRFAKAITPSSGEATANTMNVDCGFPVTGCKVIVQAYTTAGVPIALGHVIVPTAGGGANLNKITIDYTDIVGTDVVNVDVEETVGGVVG